MADFRVGALPGGAMDAAAAFHADALPQLRHALETAEDHLTIIFASADHAHRDWRLAVIRELARVAAPVRVNALESDDEAAITAALAYCADAPGLTGQMLSLDSNGAGALLSEVS